MSNVLLENVNKLGKNSYDAVKDLVAVNNTFAEQLIEQQFALFSLGVEYTTSQLKLVSTANGFKEILNGQTEIASEISSKLEGIARNTLDIFNESRDEINAWFEKNVQEAEKGIKEVAKVVPISTKAA